MRLLVFTQAELTTHNRALIDDYFTKLVQDVKHVIFAFTEETAATAGELLLHYSNFARQGRRVQLSAAVQNQISDLPAVARHAVEACGKTKEYRFGTERTGYNQFHVQALELVRGKGEAVFFWDGNSMREPWATISHLKAHQTDADAIGYEVVGLKWGPVQKEAPTPRLEGKRR